MNEETRRGYDLPLTTQKWRGWLILVVAILVVLSLELRMGRQDFSAQNKLLMRCVDVILLVPLVLTEIHNSLAKIHFVSEGIAVTVFGKTTRQIPREKLGLFGGVTYTYKSRVEKYIAVSAKGLLELAEEQERRTPPMLRNARSRPGWAEDTAGKYLFRYAASLLRQFGLTKKDILLIEWSPERLELLLEMYPGVPWVDLTEKKKLDAERKAGTP